MHTTTSLLSRRAALARLAMLSAGLLAGCTPVRLVLRAYPQRFDDDEHLREQVLRAFVRAVAPAANLADPYLARVFDDRFFPFHKYRNFFVADLCRRSERRFRQPAFHRLDTLEQAAVIRDGLAGDTVTRRLYAGATFLAQLSVLGGIYAEDAAVPALGFEGVYEFRGLDAVTHRDPARFFARALTRDGNPS